MPRHVMRYSQNFDCYIKILYAMEKVKCCSYKGVPNNVIYNMDKVGSDTTKHQSKVIANAAAIIRNTKRRRMVMAK
jgi:hypothetical protein